MATPLSLLLVEDNAHDAELLVRALTKAGYAPDWRRVETEADYLAALHARLDLVLSDFALPQFNGLRALELLNQSQFDVPLILVSATIGEDVAVEAMKKGAADYLLKDRLARLGPAVAHVLDQTRLRRERQQSLESLRLFRSLVDQSSDAFEIIDPETGRFLDVNESECRELGFSREEMLAMGVLDIDAAMQATGWARFIGQIRTSGRLSGRGQHRRKDGSTFPIEFNARLVRLDREYIVTVVRNITERMLAEEALQTSEERFRQLAESIHEVFWLSDPAKQRMLYVSPAYAAIWGRPVETLYLRPEDWLDGIHPADRARVREAATTRQVTGGYLEEYRVVRPDGSERWIRDQAYPVRDAAGRIYRVAGVAEDITERKQLAAQLLQSQKLEAIGQLSGGVAHDFNNLLTVIKGHIGLLRADNLIGPAIAGSIGEISQAADRAARLTRQLLTFSRRQVLQPVDLDMNLLVRDMLTMLRRLLREDIELEVKLADGVLPIRADSGMVEQVLLNLAVNARDAMTKGGRLRITTESVESGSPPAGRTLGPGGYARLSVSDTGTGIAPEIMARIFEPFFTTKEVGQGTGLGLATVYGIMQQHDGWIEVESEPGHGATFRAYFPGLANSAPVAATAAIEDVRGGKEIILLVEDEQSVRLLGEMALAGLGYRVLTADSSAQALDLWVRQVPEIDLLLTDLVMPGAINGRELAARIQSAQPGLPVVYMSGYGHEVAGDGLVLVEGRNFLQKPFDVGRLARIVRRTLDERPPR